MKRTDVNPLPASPSSALEREIFEKVESLSGERVLHFWSRETYPALDVNEEPVRLESDYEVWTFRLFNGLVAAGTVFKIWVTPDGVRINEEGGWRA